MIYFIVSIKTMKYYDVSFHIIDPYICINLNLKEIFVTSIVDAHIFF